VSVRRATRYAEPPRCPSCQATIFAMACLDGAQPKVGDVGACGECCHLFVVMDERDPMVLESFTKDHAKAMHPEDLERVRLLERVMRAERGFN
jgi:hypothetical protein